MNRNQLILLIAVSILLTLYTHYFRPVPSVAPATNTTEVNIPATQKMSNGSLQGEKKYHIFDKFRTGTPEEVVLENEVMQVVFTTQGGGVKEVILTKYKDHCQRPLSLLDDNSNQMGFQFLCNSTVINTKELVFEKTTTTYEAKKNPLTVTFTLSISPTEYFRQVFTLSQTSYELQCHWEAVGMTPYFGKKTPSSFIWEEKIKSLEEDIKANQQKTTINYYLADKHFKNLKDGSNSQETEKIETPVKWVGIKQRFFTAAIIGHNPFQGGYVNTVPITDDPHVVKYAKMDLALPTVDKEGGEGTFTFFFGPNHYQVLKDVTPGFEENIPLGWLLIRWINKWLIIPIFMFLEQYICNYGLIILLLVLIIKLLLAPLSYKSYISMAKMKALKPALDKIKERYSKDPQKMQMEQISLYKDVGINPISGCIPVLLQMPILLAMFNFFPNAIALRQASFLWAHDLSTYDAIVKLPFTIPIYGSHVSLFTLLMALSTVLYTWSNNQGNPSEGFMRTLSYIMPFTFMFILNSFPAGLSFYYFVSNLATFGQQVLIKKFVDEGSLEEKLIAHKYHQPKGRNKSKFQEHVQTAMRETKNKKSKK